LEPIDPNIDQSIPSGPWLIEWSDFQLQETKPDRVRWEAYFLPAGTHSVSYRVVAVTPGTWLLPPAKAESQQQPEVMGLSSGGQIVVTDFEVAPEDVDSILAKKSVVISTGVEPEECPQQCSTEEYCNFRMQKCKVLITDMITTFTSPGLRKSPPVKNVKVKNNRIHQGRRSITLEWELPTEAIKPKHYVVQYKPLTKTTKGRWIFAKGGRRVPPQQPHLLIKELSTYRHYKFRIKLVAYNSKPSDWSEARIDRIRSTPPTSR